MHPSFSFRCDPVISMFLFCNHYWTKVIWVLFNFLFPFNRCLRNSNVLHEGGMFPISENTEQHAVEDILQDLPNLIASSWIYVANSLAGHKTNTVGPSLELCFRRSTRINPRRRYASALDEQPIFATATISWPFIPVGDDWAWIQFP